MFIALFAISMFSACSDDSSKASPDASAPDQKVADAPPATCATSAYLPADKAVGDLALTGTYQAAASASQLNALINGGSEKYFQNKFICMVQAFYKSAAVGHEVKVWIFDQTDKAGAEAAYKATANPDDAEISPTLGDASRENLKLLTAYTADMRKGKHLVRLVLDKKSQAADGPALLKVIDKALP